MDAAGAMDAQNAPTAPWKTAQTAVSHSAHTHHWLTRSTHEIPDTPECPVWYRERLLARQRIDLVVDGKLVVEVKAIDRVAPVHHAQVMSYLRASGLRAGLLVNFNEAILKDGLRRVVV